MKYYIDLDNTLCKTVNGDYNNSTPIIERIHYVNKLKEDGHTVTIWTARGSISKIDYKDLTVKQLKELDELEKNWNGVSVAPVITKQIEFMIKSVAGNRDIMNIHNFVENLPIKDSQDFRKFVNLNKPGLDLTQNVTTPSGDTIQIEIGFGVEFFRPFYGI